MKFLSKLIALSCAVCMVGVVWGADWGMNWKNEYDMYVFKDGDKWKAATLLNEEKKIVPIQNHTTTNVLPENIHVLKEINVNVSIGENDYTIFLRIINKPTETSIEIQNIDEDKEIIHSINHALEQHDNGMNMYVFKDDNKWNFIIFDKDRICLFPNSDLTKLVTNPKEIKSYTEENLDKYTLYSVSNKPKGTDSILVDSNKNAYEEKFGTDSLPLFYLFGSKFKDNKNLISLVKETLNEYDKNEAKTKTGEKVPEKTPEKPATTDKPKKETKETPITPLPKTSDAPSLLNLTRTLRDLSLEKA